MVDLHSPLHPTLHSTAHSPERIPPLHTPLLSPASLWHNFLRCGGGKRGREGMQSAGRRVQGRVQGF